MCGGYSVTTVIRAYGAPTMAIRPIHTRCTRDSRQPRLPYLLSTDKNSAIKIQPSKPLANFSQNTLAANGSHVAYPALGSNTCVPSDHRDQSD